LAKVLKTGKPHKPRKIVNGKRPKKREPVEQSKIRSFLVDPFLRELRSGGVQADDLLRRRGLLTQQRVNLYEQVSLVQYVALLEDAAELLNRPYLGLELGGGFELADLGPMYGSFVCATSVGSALNQLIRYQSALQTNTLSELVRGSEVSVWRYRIEHPAIWPRRQDAELALALFTTFVRLLTDAPWRPLAVEYEHEIVGRERTLRDFHGAPVYGNRPYNALVIDNADVDRPLRYRSDATKRDVGQIVERHMKDLLGWEDRTNEPIEARARQLIASRLGRTKVTIESIAAEMNMSVRNLRRQLTHAGTSYREILQQHRRKAVEAMLDVNGERLATVANRLNYSDASALSRAFKYWTGVSPRKYAKTSAAAPFKRVTPKRVKLPG